MSKQFETGLAREATNFEQIILRCVSFGSSFNPANPFIQVPALQNKHADILQAIETHKTIEVALGITTNDREILFAKIHLLFTRLMANLKSLGLSKQTIDDAVAINRVLHGRRKTPKKSGATSESQVPSSNTGEAAPTEAQTKKISVSHMSYVSRADNVSKMVALLAGLQNYASNEPDLTLQALQLFAAELHAANTAVGNLLAQYKVSWASRQEILYHPETGMANLSRQVREYVKALYGPKSPQFKSIQSLVVRARKI